MVKQTSNVNFKLRNVENHKALSTPVNVNRLKPFYGRNLRPAETTVPNDVEHRVELSELTDHDLPSDSFTGFQ